MLVEVGSSHAHAHCQKPMQLKLFGRPPSLPGAGSLLTFTVERQLTYNLHSLPQIKATFTSDSCFLHCSKTMETVGSDWGH